MSCFWGVGASRRGDGAVITAGGVAPRGGGRRIPGLLLASITRHLSSRKGSDRESRCPRSRGQHRGTAQWRARKAGCCRKPDPLVEETHSPATLTPRPRSVKRSPRPPFVLHSRAAHGDGCVLCGVRMSRWRSRYRHPNLGDSEPSRKSCCVLLIGARSTQLRYHQHSPSWPNNALNIVSLCLLRRNSLNNTFMVWKSNTDNTNNPILKQAFGVCEVSHT